jgi:hypothetical protein
MGQVGTFHQEPAFEAGSLMCYLGREQSGGFWEEIQTWLPFVPDASRRFHTLWLTSLRWVSMKAFGPWEILS